MKNDRIKLKQTSINKKFYFSKKSLIILIIKKIKSQKQMNTSIIKHSKLIYLTQQMKEFIFCFCKKKLALSIIWHFSKNNKINSLVGSIKHTHFQILIINHYHQEVQEMTNIKK